MFTLRLVILLSLSFTVATDPLEGTEPFEIRGDPAERIVTATKRYLLRATQESIAKRKPDIVRLAYILGVVDPRIPFTQFETFAPLGSSPALAKSPECEGRPLL